MKLSQYQKESIFSGAGYGVILLYMGGVAINFLSPSWAMVAWCIPAIMGAAAGYIVVYNIRLDRRDRAQAAIESED